MDRSSLTWGDFKQYIEEQGVKDSDIIQRVDVDLQPGVDLFHPSELNIWIEHHRDGVFIATGITKLADE